MKVDYHWDKLKMCVVGKCYPPEFFSFVNDVQARIALEKIAIETNEDLDTLSSLIESFGVTVLRPVISDSVDDYIRGTRFFKPPLTPRDYFAMIGNKFYMPTCNDQEKWNQLKGQSWPVVAPRTAEEFNCLPRNIKHELKESWNIVDVGNLYNYNYNVFKNIEKTVAKTNTIIYDQNIDSAMTIRLGRNLIFGTWPWQTKNSVSKLMAKRFPDHVCRVLKTNGHLDGVINVASENLIISSDSDIANVLKKLFPLAELFFLNSSMDKKQAYVINQSLIDYSKNNLYNWTGNFEETVLDVNLLHIDKNNIIGISENDTLIKKLESHKITFHNFKFRHAGFWDCGVHCLTNDLSRI